MAMEWGLCPLPTQDDCPLTAHSLLPPSPALGRLTEPPLRGAHSPSLTGLLSHSPVSGVIQKACYSEEDSVSRHQCRFPGSHSPLLVLSQLRPQKPPRAPSPMALPGRSLPSGLVLLSHIPCRVARSSHCPGQAVCSVLGRPPWCQVQEPTGTWGAPPCCTAASSCLLTSSLWVGPGPTVCPGSHLIPVLPMGELLGYSVPAAQRGSSFTHPSQEHRVLVGRLLQGYGAHLGRCPAGLSSQEPGLGCRAPPVHLLVRSDP